MGSKLGFIGLGAMGQPMASHLMQAGHSLHVWARTPERAAAALEAGAQWAASPATLADTCEVVFVCVTDTAAVEEVALGESGLIAARSGAIIVDHSTIHPLATQTIAARLADTAGLRWVDAPVSGGAAGAAAGTLVVMAGGAAADLDQVRPLIDSYAARVTHMGATGTGQATKIANQMLIGGNVAVLAEALSYAHNFGVRAADLPDALGGGWADSSVLQNHGRRMARAAYPDVVDARLMAKDIDIACDLGRHTGSPMPVTALVQQLYRQLIAAGDADKGQIGLMWLYQQKPL